MNVGLYARVSRSDATQNPENQLLRMREYAKSHGWTVHKEYVDEASGADQNRPALDEMLSDARARRFSVVLCTKIDRIARSTANLYSILSALEDRGVGFECTDQDISMKSSTG